MATSDRGVSEVVGFVLAFSLIVSTTAIVYTVGFGGLQELRDDERIGNGERAFDVLGDNVADIIHRGAPSRGTEIKLSGLSVSTAPATTFNVSVDRGGSSVVGVNVSSRPLVLSDGETDVVYEAGSVMRVQDRGAVLKRRPGFALGPERTVLDVPALTSAGESTGGSATVLIRTSLDTDGTDDPEATRLLVARSGATYNVTFRVFTTPGRAPVWERYLETEIQGNGLTPTPPSGSDPCTVSGGRVSCYFETRSVYVHQTVIDIEFA